MDRVSIRAARESWSDSTLLYFVEINGNKMDQDGIGVEPKFVLNLYDTQKLFDDLYIAGLRPSEERYETSAYRQAQEHINDLRGVVGKLFGLIDRQPMFAIAENIENEGEK